MDLYPISDIDEHTHIDWDIHTIINLYGHAISYSNTKANPNTKAEASLTDCDFCVIHK